ncbi:WD repeat domain-containing protein [Seiridium cupressi]
MSHAWLDSLSEDWVSQPRSDNSQAQLPVFSDSPSVSRQSNVRQPVSGRTRSIQLAKKPQPPTTNDALGERSSNDINIQASHRVSSKSSDGSQASQRGRHLSRSFSASASGSVLHDTIQHKSFSASPAKSKGSIPEWRRRLLHGEGSYAEPMNLFSSAGTGLENMFRPPPPPPDALSEQLHDEGHTTHDMTLPSSPPPYARSRQQHMPDRTFEESSLEFSEIRPHPQGERPMDRRNNGIHEDSHGPDTSTVEHSAHAQDMATQDQKEASFTSITAKQRFDASRKTSGKSDVRNEDFSPIFLTLHNNEDGRVSFAPTQLSADSLRERLDKLRQNQFVKSSVGHSRGRESTSTRDDLDTTQDYARQGGFLNLKRGGFSVEGSFRYRPLSPLHHTDTSEMLPESSLQASTPKQFPGTVRTTAPTEQTEQTDHSASLSPELLRVPNPSPVKRSQHSQSTTGSPLKLFGPYDTFTNQTLMRRISQFEDPMSESPSRSLDNSVEELEPAMPFRPDDSRGTPAASDFPRKQQVSRGHHEVFGAVNRFGAGQLDDYVFSEEISLNPSDQSELVDKENIVPGRTSTSQSRAVVFDLAHDSSFSESEALRLRRRRTRSSTNGSSSKHSVAGPRSRPTSSSNGGVLGRYMLGTPKRDGSEGKRPRTSPSKDPTPKRRRTLHRSDIGYGLEERPAAIEAVQSIHYQMQSGIGRKRKETRQGELLPPADPAIMVHRQAIRPRTPTPSQRSSVQREREALTEIHCSADGVSMAFSAEGSEVLTRDFAVDESRKTSMKTQDFCVEAERIMAMIRNKVRPHALNGLSSVEESEAEVSNRHKSETPHEPSEDSYEESFEEPFVRPPSREGRPVLRLPTRQEDPEVVDRLKKYEEVSEMGDLISYSMRSMGLAKEAIQEVNKINQSVQASIRSSETRHGIPEVGDIISDLSNVRLSRNPDASMDDGYGPLPSHGSQSSNGSTGLSIPTASSRGSDSRRLIGPDAVSQLIGDHVGNMLLDKENKVWMKVKTPKPEVRDFSIVPSEDSEDDPFASIPDLSVDIHKEKQHLALKTAPLEDLEEYLKEDFPHPPSSGKKSHATDKSLDIESILSHTKETFENIKRTVAETVGRAEEEIEHEITLHEDRVQKSSPSRRRNLTITFSSPIASIIHDILPRPSEGDTTLEEASVIETSIGETTTDSLRRGRGANPDASTGTKSAQSRSRSRSKSLGRNLSVKGRAFVPRPVSRIDEQDEDTAIDFSVLEQRQLSVRGESSVVVQDDHEHGQNSVSFVITTPAPMRHISQTSATPVLRDHVGTLSLSPLSEFTMNHGDRSNALEVSYVVEDNYLVTGDGSRRVMSQAIRNLVEKITEVEPFEPDWDAMQVLDIKGKQLRSLHKLDEFCGGVITLDASNNFIDHLDGVPESVRNLKMTHNHLSELTAWGHLMNLQYVDISNNQINSLHAFKELVHLRSLRADNNQITSLDGIKFHDALQSLRVRNNLMEEVDLDGTTLNRLTELDLQGNQISLIANIEQLPSLSTLNLDDNRLDSIATSTGDIMSSLKYLRLSNNSVTSLNLALFPSLRLLHADRNRLVSLKGFSRARRLDSLSLREQKGDVPLDLSFLKAAYEVRKLFLSGNLLTTFEPKVDFLNLQYLELANCGLQSLEENFGQLMPNLRTLNLNFNAVEDLSALRYIPRLKKLLAAGNRLSDTGALANLLAEFPHLSKLDLRDNPATLGFYPPVQTLVSVEPDSDFDPFVLPDASKDRDDGFAGRLDVGTKQRRRFYEIVVAQRCGRLKVLDGLPMDRQRIKRKDSVRQALLERGAIAEVAKEAAEDKKADVSGVRE